MKRILKYLGVMAVMGMAAAACGGTGKTSRVSGDRTMPTTEPSITDTVTVAEIEENEDDSVCSGDTLTQYDGKTYMVDYWEEAGDFKGRSTTFVVGFRGRERVDTCRVDGESMLLTAEGKTLKVAIGVDTVRYDITRLPKRIEPIRKLMQTDYRKHTVDHTFPIGISDWECQYRFYAYLPEEYPEWLRQYVAAALYSELQNFMTDGPQKNELVQYQRLREDPRLYKGLDTSEASIETIARYFGRRFERLYRQRFDLNDVEEGWFGMLNEYSFEVTPAWKSDDGRLETYRFYSFEFGGGVHGMMYEYYLTFETETGRILGRSDLYSDAEFKKAMSKLGKELDIRRFGEPDQGQTADVGDESDISPFHMKHYEKYHGKYYPRPALLGDRVVFSYQPYDKGCFAEGILHFALPYLGK